VERHEDNPTSNHEVIDIREDRCHDSGAHSNCRDWCTGVVLAMIRWETRPRDTTFVCLISVIAVGLCLA